MDTYVLLKQDHAYGCDQTVCALALLKCTVSEAFSCICFSSTCAT